MVSTSNGVWVKGIYETLKVTYLRYMDTHEDKRKNQDLQPNVLVLWACGMVSGSIGATTVYPLNLVRTRHVFRTDMLSKDGGLMSRIWIGYKHKAHQVIRITIPLPGTLPRKHSKRMAYEGFTRDLDLLYSR